MMTPREQGDAGELSAMLWYAARGASIYLPFGHSPHVDFVALLPAGEVRRVQVKTSTCFNKNRWSVMVCTRGGNQSWNGVSKYLDPSRFDDLCVVVGDGRRWVIPSEAIVSTSGLLLGGPKYEHWEVEAGLPLGARQDVAPMPL